MAQAAGVLFAQAQFGWNAKQLGIYITARSAAAVIGQAGLVKLLSPRFNERTILLLGCGAQSLGLLLMAFTTQGWQAYALLVFTVIGSASQPAMNSVVSQSVPPSEIGQVQGALRSMGLLATTVGLLVGPAAFGYFTSLAAPFLFAGSAYIIAAICAAIAFAFLWGGSFTIAPASNAVNSAVKNSDEQAATS
jgi:DHA1 family tetracycline resistance protein-like MFS transporter